MSGFQRGCFRLETLCILSQSCGSHSKNATAVGISRDEVGVVAALPQLHGEVHEARHVLRPLLALHEKGGVLLVDGAVVLLLDLGQLHLFRFISRVRKTDEANWTQGANVSVFRVWEKCYESRASAFGGWLLIVPCAMLAVFFLAFYYDKVLLRHALFKRTVDSSCSTFTQQQPGVGL